MCTSAHQGIMKGLPIHEITVQSNVKTLTPRLLTVPKIWLRGTLFGAIQQIQENIESAWKR
jgi:hypothetical protein